jgi:C1A family cysteine protease
MKTIAILALVGIAATAFFAFSSSTSSETENQFRDFLNTHRVGYGTTEEFSYRLSVFESNLNIIARLNQENPEATFAVNQFADRTPEEMSAMRGYQSTKPVVGTYVAPTSAASVDWTNMWSAVKNQGQCGSCWAFSATAGFEARYALNNGAKTVSTLFSEQELVDCDTQSSGCNGGLMDFAFEYLEKNGFCTEEQYPYTARDGTCSASKCTSGPMDKAFTDIPAKNEDSLLSALSSGPVSVAVDANSWSFYSSGIMSSCGKSLDHGVTLIKYNAEEGSATIRNSWGSSWGESGLIRLKAGQDTCGYADAASYPTF